MRCLGWKQLGIWFPNTDQAEKKKTCREGKDDRKKIKRTQRSNQVLLINLQTTGNLLTMLISYKRYE